MAQARRWSLGAELTPCKPVCVCWRCVDSFLFAVSDHLTVIAWNKASASPRLVQHILLLPLLSLCCCLWKPGQASVQTSGCLSTHALNNTSCSSLGHLFQLDTCLLLPTMLQHVLSLLHPKPGAFCVAKPTPAQQSTSFPKKLGGSCVPCSASSATSWHTLYRLCWCYWQQLVQPPTCVGSLIPGLWRWLCSKLGCPWFGLFVWTVLLYNEARVVSLHVFMLRECILQCQRSF